MFCSYILRRDKGKKPSVVAGRPRCGNSLGDSIPPGKDSAMARIGGLVGWLFGALWLYRWEAIRAFLYEKGFDAMSSVASETLTHWGVPILFAGIGTFLFWKTGDSGFPDWEAELSYLRIPLHVAARRVYEAAEKANVLDFLISSNDSAAKKLSHLKMLIMVDDRVRLFAIKPPSTKPRLLSKSERTGELYPSDDDNSELHLVTGGDPEYVNATIPRSDLRSAIKTYLAEYVDETKRLRAGKWPR